MGSSPEMFVEQSAGWGSGAVLEVRGAGQQAAVAERLAHLAFGRRVLWRRLTFSGL